MKNLILLSALTVCLSHAALAETGSGDMIDQLIKKQADLGQAVTAESALPAKHEAKVEAPAATTSAKSEAENQQPVFNNPSVIGSPKADAPKNIWARMLGSLAIALVLFGGTVYGLKKWPNAAKKLSGRTKMIEILSQQYLGPKRSLAIIRVAGESVLVGVTDNNITLLKTLSLLDDDIPAEKAEAQFTLKKPSKQNFTAALGLKFSEPDSSREEEFSMQGLKEIIGERLKSMKEI